MSETAGERRQIEPSEQLKSEFRTTIEASVGREPLDPKIVVGIDENGYYAEFEVESHVVSPGQRSLIYTYYHMSSGGKVTRMIEGEPLGTRLARDIRANSVIPRLNRLQGDIKMLCEDFGLTEDEAYEVVMSAQLATVSESTASALLSTLKAVGQQEQLGLNKVDAFELAEVIEKIQNNYPIV